MTKTPSQTLQFKQGSLLLQPSIAGCPKMLRPFFMWDERTLEWRAEARRYRQVMQEIQDEKIAVQDQARQYERLSLSLKKQLVPRKHQQEALDAWTKVGGRGVVCLPTGAGKTILAVMTIAKIQRPTLVVVPTIDLMQQWEKVLKEFFDCEIGLLGGGEHSVGALTVATYDSAALRCEQIGSRFGFVVFDECHHLPAPQYQMIAKCLIAPFRLGLSATVERADGKEELIYELVGDICYEGHIHEMSNKVLAPYQVINIQVPMLPEEQAEYQAKRKIYTNFLRHHRIDMSSPEGWSRFVWMSARGAEGKEAMQAYRAQKRLAQASSAKMQYVWNILQENCGERIIIFTDENTLAYKIGERFFVPVLTHHTKLRERKKMLEMFRSGAIDVLVTSKVLNEGVDVPEASIGIVVSGSATVREHVQRLGRILRHKDDKVAKLYEIVSKGTGEYYVNARRKQHYAYQRSSEVSHS